MRTTKVCFLALVIALTPAAVRAAPGITDEQVGQAIDQMRTALYGLQEKGSGSWDGNYSHGHAYPGAVTALALYGLLASGESPQRPDIDQALKHVRLSQRSGTYQVSLYCHVWGYLPDEPYRRLLESDTRWLQQAANDTTTFGYTPSDSGRGGFDHSNTQYGVLGLWEGAKRGVHVDDQFWRNVVEHWTGCQNPDGGWGYKADGKSTTHTMTSAGLTALFIAQQEAYRRLPKPDPKLSASIAKALAWMDANFSPNAGGKWRGYYAVGVERVGLASGIKEFGGKDWYRELAGDIVRGRSGAIVDTSFHLVFLSRGRVPVWCTKLIVPGLDWNNRPNDVYFLTDFLSDYREGELNWQVLSLESPVESLLSTPLLYFSSDQALNLNDGQKAKLKRYLDLGGLLWVNPEGGSANTVASVKQLAEELYPTQRMTPLPAHHPLFNALVPVPSGGIQVLGLSNGARERILMPLADWGMSFQADNPEARTTAQWKVAANLYALATDRGLLANRLVDRFEARTGNGGSEVIVGRARYDGNWLPEPGAWEPVATRLANKHGVSLQVTADGAAKTGAGPDTLDLDQLGECKYKLVHLAGTQAVKLNPAQLQAIQQYAQNGGTVLVEGVGGAPAFTTSIEEQLRPLLGGPAVPLNNRPDDPVLSGQGLNNGYDTRSVTYRRFAVLQMPEGNRRPRLLAMFVGTRPAVILSPEDLSLGALSVSRWGVLGYEHESALRLMCNLVLAANANTVAAPETAPASQPATP